MSKPPQYCPYKEYWFGDGYADKPAACKFKRGALLKLKKGYARTYESEQSGVRCETLPKEGAVLFLLDYNSELVKDRVWNLGNEHYSWIEVTEHKFTFLFGEKFEVFVVKTWGEHYSSWHNEMWHKARKDCRPPIKKPKKRGEGFIIDEE